MREREEAWVGDAVLALFMRRLILKEQGKMDGEMFIPLHFQRFSPQYW